MTPDSPARSHGDVTPRRPGTRLRLESLEDRSVPATFNVTTTQDVFDPLDGKRSLREAITAANGLDGADLIVVPAGVYKITDPGAGDNQNRSGDFDIRDSVTIRGAGTGLSIIDGQQLDRVLDVFGDAPSSIKVVVEKLTVRNGNVTGHGGGVQVVNANLVVRDCAVSGNRASETGGGVSNGSSAGTGDVRVVRTAVARNVSGTNGGGLGVFGSSLLTVKDSTVRRNVAGSPGGGIATNTATLTNCTVNANTTPTDGGGINAGTATLTNCTVSGNSARGNGGGIRATTATLTGSTVSGNSARFGGGMAIDTVTLTDSTVSGNSAFDGLGGGIAVGTATLTNCTVSGNSAATDGGGIAAGMATLTNTTVSGNTGDRGGGLHATAATLLNCTVVENISQFGGGLRHNPGGVFNVRNTIVALNLGGILGINPDVAGDFSSQGHNLIGDGTGGTGFTDGVNGDIVGTSASPIDPKLGPLQNNGGKTKTHALLAGSRAIDAGDNLNLPPTDQRGFARKKDGNFNGVARVDIGAFER